MTVYVATYRNQLLGVYTTEEAAMAASRRLIDAWYPESVDVNIFVARVVQEESDGR